MDYSILVTVDLHASPTLASPPLLVPLDSLDDSFSIWCRLVFSAGQSSPAKDGTRLHLSVVDPNNVGNACVFKKISNLND
jgi:hypothetical protein